MIVKRTRAEGEGKRFEARGVAGYVPVTWAAAMETPTAARVRSLERATGDILV
jgi:hypothetical protein